VGVWYVLRMGCQWRLLPDYYGDWRRTRKRYKQWADRGVWSDLMAEVSDIDDQSFMIDATVVRAQAAELLKEQRNTTILADKGYDSQALIDTLENQDCSLVIASKINAKNPRKIDNWHYKERFLVEAFFSKMKHFRRVFSRFDKTVSAFLGFLHFVGALIWMR
jgi:transposase